MCVCACVLVRQLWHRLVMSDTLKQSQTHIRRQQANRVCHSPQTGCEHPLQEFPLVCDIMVPQHTQNTPRGEDRHSQKASAAAGCLAPALMVCMSSSGIRLQPQQGGNNADYQGNACNASRLPKLLD